MKKIPNVLVL